jgi:hypothetical protein
VSQYHRGIAALAGIKPKAFYPAQVGFDLLTIVTPDRVRSRAADLDVAWQSLTPYASAAAELAGWNAFYQRLKNASWYDLGNAASQDLDTWTARYEAARRAAGAVNSPPGAVVGPDSGKPDTGSFWRPVAIGVVSGLSLTAALWALSRFRGPIG